MILVTGGAGFIGSNFILDWLSRSDEPVLNVDLLTYAGRLENLAQLDGDPRHVFVHGSICDQERMQSLLDHYRPRAVVNFAAETHVDRSIHGPAGFIKTNVEGTFGLLQAARAFHAGLDERGRHQFRFLHVSTDEVYGSLLADDPPFSESTPYAPNSPYSASKAASDHLVRAWHHTYGLPTLTTNCSNNYGPLQFPEKLIPLVISRALKGQALPVYGDGQQIRDWLYVGDHCDAIRRVLEAGVPGEMYNIGGRNEVTNLEVVQSICRLLDELAPRADGASYLDQVSFVTDRPGHDRRYAIDSSKIESRLGWFPAENFTSGLRKTVEWYLAHAAWMQDAQSASYLDWMATNYERREAPLAGASTAIAGSSSTTVPREAACR